MLIELAKRDQNLRVTLGDVPMLASSGGRTSNVLPSHRNEDSGSDVEIIGEVLNAHPIHRTIKEDVSGKLLSACSSYSKLLWRFLNFCFLMHIDLQNPSEMTAFSTYSLF